MISCLTVTREGRLEELGRAVRCFARQTLEGCELLVLHDGSDRFDEDVRALAARETPACIRTRRAPRGLPLGALRNLSVQLAAHDLVCQWDDDDLCHPRRLEVQYAELRRAGADFCFFTDQLHWFEPSGELFWDDWTVERYPMSLIQGTMMGSRERLGRYPSVPRGEDTPVVVNLVERGCRVAPLADHGYLHIYVYNGRNAWDGEHHRAISEWKRLEKDRLLERAPALETHLVEYDLPGVVVTMPHEDGALRFRLSGD